MEEIYQRIFDKIDTTKSGVLDFHNIRVGYSKVLDVADLASVRALDALKEFGLSQDGTISFSNFQQAMAKFDKSVTVLGVFLRLDQDGDGRVTLSDCQSVSEETGESLEKSKQDYEAVDTQHKGYFTFSDLEEFIKKTVQS